MLIAVTLLIGAVIGTLLARRVEMTQMPEMIAILHSFVGIAAVLVGINSYLTERDSTDTVHLVEVFLGIFIGAVTFTGSIIAYLKLSARMKSSPLALPGRHASIWRRWCSVPSCWCGSWSARISGRCWR